MTDSIFDFNPADRKEGERTPQVNKALVARQNAALRESEGWVEVEKLRRQISSEDSIDLTSNCISGQIPVAKFQTQPNILKEPIKEDLLLPTHDLSLNQTPISSSKIVKRNYKRDDSGLWMAILKQMVIKRNSRDLKKAV